MYKEEDNGTGTTLCHGIGCHPTTASTSCGSVWSPVQQYPIATDNARSPKALSNYTPVLDPQLAQGQPSCLHLMFVSLPCEGCPGDPSSEQPVSHQGQPTRPGAAKSNTQRHAHIHTHACTHHTTPHHTTPHHTTPHTQQTRHTDIRSQAEGREKGE